MTHILLDRNVNIEDETILFHYCSTSTFQAICETKTVRFSDINMMNDYTETGYSYNIFELAASELIQSDLPGIGRIKKDFFDRVDEIISPQQLFVHPVIACFSWKPDVLSQWARYAANGSGFSLGFSGRALKALPVTVGAVCYDRAQQIHEMKIALGSIYLQNREEGGDFGKKFVESCQLLSAEMAFLKHPSFAEEHEVRLLHLLDAHRDSQRWWLTDEGGMSEGHEVKGEKVKFRISDETLIAYIDLKFPETYSKKFLRNIKRGPRNRNGVGNIFYMLGDREIENVIVTSSDCPYR